MKPKGMTVPPPLDVLAFYDSPRLFTAREPGGEFSLWVVSDEDGESDAWTWIVAILKKSTYDMMMSGKIDFFGAFRASKGGSVAMIKEHGGDIVSTDWIETHLIPNDDLPLPGCFLEAENG